MYACTMFRKGDCEGFYNTGNDHGREGGDFDEISATHKRNLDSTSDQQVEFKRIRLSTDLNPQVIRINFCKESSPLGLKLSKTPSFINLIEMKLSQARKTSDHQDLRVKMDYEKLKASNFSATLLRIGTWERLSRNEGDLIAKCYYAKKKIVWEILEGALKSKIEIQWSDIIGISAVLHDDQPGILEIELNNPPSYFQETNPQPRKHTLWHQATDFTGGQAPMYRRHYVVFPPGVLDKHYEKLLQCDHRLFELSKKIFPTLNNPYFGQRLYGFSGYSCNPNRNGSEFPPELQYHAQNFPTPVVHPHHHVQNFKVTPNPPLGIVDSTSPLSDMDHERARNCAIENQRAMFWSQGVNNIWAQSSMNMATKGNPEFPYQEFHPINSGEDQSGMNTPNSGISFNEIENHLLADSQQVVCSDENTLLATVYSLSSLLDPQELNPNTNNNIILDQLAVRTDQNHENFGVPNTIDEYPGGLSFPKPVSWLPPQDSNMNMIMNPSNNQALYPYVLPEPTHQDCADLDASQDIRHHWA